MCLTNRRPSFYRSHKDVRTCESSRLAASSTWTNANGSSSANNVGRKSRSKLPVAVKSHVELRARARFARQEKLFGEAKAVASTSRIPRPVKSPHTTASLDRRYTNSTEVLASASSNKSEDNPLASSAASSAGVFQMETDAPRRGNVSNLKIISEEISPKKNVQVGPKIVKKVGRKERIRSRRKNRERGIVCGLNFTGAAQLRKGADPVAVGSTSHPDRNDVELRWTLAIIRRIPLFAVDVSDVARKVCNFICRCDLLIAGEQSTNDTTRIALSTSLLMVSFLTAAYSSAF